MSPARSIPHKLRSTFLSGLVVVLPVLVCIVIVTWLIRIAESFFGAIPRLLLPDGWYFPGLGILIALVVIMLVGMFLHAWLFNRLVERGEHLLERIPVIKTLYMGARDLLGFFSHSGESGEDLKHVVLVEVQKDIHTIGFVTANDVAEDFPELLDQRDENDRIVAVYLQMGYQVGGYTIYVPASRVRRLDMSVEDALRVVLTANVNRPHRLGEHDKAEPPGEGA